MHSDWLRAPTLLAAFVMVMVALPALAISVVADSTQTCWIGNNNQKVKVFEHINFNQNESGIKDDLCWKDGKSRDKEFSQNESNLDDIGENGNFHDLVSSFKVTNNGNQICASNSIGMRI